MVLVRDWHLLIPELTPQLRRWRYEGIEIVSLTDMCEMAYQAVPLQLVTEAWLFRASSQSGLLYIKKLKRLFDIVAALFFILLLGPALLAGMLAVRLSSPGPVFFRQKRLGKMGKEFNILKLRTMHVDAEKDGPQWSKQGDPRVFLVGKWLRQFRVDEIPQLFNIFAGQMSFVGPRPERPEFIEELENKIPYYRERLLLQPGLTGWAQVRYPYGASMVDAWRKHEHDLFFDETVFPQPRQVRLDRKPNPHLSFGFGTHLCLGAPHARLILRTLLKLCCERVQRITLIKAEERTEHEARFDRTLGYDSLVVKLTAL